MLFLHNDMNAARSSPITITSTFYYPFLLMFAWWVDLRASVSFFFFFFLLLNVIPNTDAKQTRCVTAIRMHNGSGKHLFLFDFLFFYFFFIFFIDTFFYVDK